MQKVATILTNAIANMYGSRRKLFIIKNKNKFNKVLMSNIDILKECIDSINSYSSDNATYKEKATDAHNTAMSVICWLSEATGNDYTTYYEQVDALYKKFLEKYNAISTGQIVVPSSDDGGGGIDIDVPTDSTSSISRTDVAKVAFALFFGYGASSLDLTTITTDCCKALLRLPAIGMLLYPYGYNDSVFWNNDTLTKNTVGAYIVNTVLSSSTYITSVRKLVKLCLTTSPNMSSVNSTCEEFLANIDNTSDVDSAFLESLYNTIYSACDDASFNYRCEMMRIYAAKGITSKCQFVPPYFPSYNENEEVLRATIMCVNRLISTFCSSTKAYYSDIDTGASISTSIADDIENWEYVEVYNNDDKVANEFANEIDNGTEVSNPTLKYTNIVFGDESTSNTYNNNDFVASNSNLTAMINTFAYANTSPLMSAIEYICVEPDANPLSSDHLDGSYLSFRIAIYSTFVKNVFSTSLEFPIAPIISTNFINTWYRDILKGNTYPQEMFDVPSNVSTDSVSAISYPDSYTFNINALLGLVQATETLTTDELFTKKNDKAS